MSKRRTPKKSGTEGQIQAAIVKYLSFMLPGDMDFFAVSNNPRSAITGALEKERGMRAGVADLCVWGSLGGGERFIGFLEIKTPTGRQSPKQKEFEARCKECGIDYDIARSVEDVREIMEKWGIL